MPATIPAMARRSLILAGGALLCGCGSASSSATASPSPAATQRPASPSAPGSTPLASPASAGNYTATVSGPDAATLAGPMSLCGRTAAAGGFTIIAIGNSTLVSLGARLTAYTGAAGYSLSSSGTGTGVLQLQSGVVIATAGTATVEAGEKTGRVVADFPNGDHLEMHFSC